MKTLLLVIVSAIALQLSAQEITLNVQKPRIYAGEVVGLQLTVSDDDEWMTNRMTFIGADWPGQFRAAVVLQNGSGGEDGETFIGLGGIVEMNFNEKLDDDGNWRRYNYPIGIHARSIWFNDPTVGTIEAHAAVAVTAGVYYKITDNISLGVLTSYGIIIELVNEFEFTVGLGILYRG